MPKPSLQKNISSTIKPISGRIRGLVPFPKGITMKVNVITYWSSNSLTRMSYSIKLAINHHHVMPPARISLTLSHHISLSFIDSGRSSGLHPVSTQSCCMYVRGGRPAFSRPYVGVHRSTPLMISSLLLQ